MFFASEPPKTPEKPKKIRTPESTAAEINFHDETRKLNRKLFCEAKKKAVVSMKHHGVPLDEQGTLEFLTNGFYQQKKMGL